MIEKFIEYIKEGREYKFYNSWTWRMKRLEIIERDNNECQVCKGEGRVGKAEVVHHIKHVKQWPELCMTDDNLITLCHYHHELEHPEKLAKYRGKKKEAINEERW